MDERSVLVVGADLSALARIDSAATRVGIRVERASVARVRARVEESAPDLVIVDLDRGRDEVLGELTKLDEAGALPPTIGYYSHVDEELRDAAGRARCRAIPRGRFFRELPELLGSST